MAEHLLSVGLDVGRPIGTAFPVVIKTLVLSRSEHSFLPFVRQTP